MEQADFLLQSPEGCTPKIGSLIAFFKVSNISIFNSVSSLSTAQLDVTISKDDNSIGTLLKHMAAIEYSYQAVTFENRKLTPEERLFWKGVLPGELIERLIHGHPIEYYLDLWQTVRENTYNMLRSKDDEWLFKRPAGELSGLGNNHYCWYHVLQDQLCHYGQIKLILKNFNNI